MSRSSSFTWKAPGHVARRCLGPGFGRGEYLITTHAWGDMVGTHCAVTGQDGVARVEVETGSELRRIEVVAPGLTATYG